MEIIFSTLTIVGENQRKTPSLMRKHKSKSAIHAVGDVHGFIAEMLRGLVQKKFKIQVVS
jgi:hypothetical protein